MRITIFFFCLTIEKPVIAVGCRLAVGGAGPNPAVATRAVLPRYADAGLIDPLLLIEIVFITLDLSYS